MDGGRTARSGSSASRAGAGLAVRDLFVRPRTQVPAQPTSLRSRAILSTTGVAVQGATRFLYSALIARLAGPVVLGAVNTSIAIALFAALLWPTAAAAAATKFVARALGGDRPDEAARVARWLADGLVAITILLGTGAGVFAVIARGASTTDGLLVGVLVVATSGYTFARGLQYGIGRIARATVWDVISAVVAVGGLLAVLFADVPALLLAPLSVGYLLFAAMSWPRRVGGRPDKAVRREIRGFVGLTILGTVASTGFLQLSMVVAGGLSDPTVVGQYAAALALATPASMISRSLSLVLFPTMATAAGRGDGAATRRQTDLTTRFLVVVMTGVFGAVVIAGDVLVPLVFGAGFEDAARLLPVMLAAVWVTTLAVGAVNFLTSGPQWGAKVSAATSLAGMAVGIGAWALLVPAAGATGVVWGFLIGSAVVGLVPVVVVAVMQRQSWWGLGARTAVGVGLATACLLGARSATAADVAPAAVVAVVAAVGYLVVWAGVCVTDLRRVLPVLAAPAPAAQPQVNAVPADRPASSDPTD